MDKIYWGETSILRGDGNIHKTNWAIFKIAQLFLSSVMIGAYLISKGILAILLLVC